MTEMSDLYYLRKPRLVFLCFTVGREPIRCEIFLQEEVNIFHLLKSKCKSLEQNTTSHENTLTETLSH